MPHSDNSETFKPFEKLSLLLKEKQKRNQKQILPAPAPKKSAEKKHPSPPNPQPKADPEDETRLFLDAMAGVAPIPRGEKIEGGHAPNPVSVHGASRDEEIMGRLENLVKHGDGFIVSDTPEYIEGAGYKIDPAITKRLHRGDFSIQAHIDLHGYTVTTAQEAVNRFLKESILTGKRAVMIIHGRGLSSPEGPVLKGKVLEWITRGLWRKWVIAYSSARPCDGGAGATYILLRKHPSTKHSRKKR